MPAAGEVVVVGPTGQRVVAVATPDGVVPPCPADQVHTPEPIDDVVGQTVDDIATFGAFDTVLLRGSEDHGCLSEADDLLLSLDRGAQEERTDHSGGSGHVEYWLDLSKDAVAHIVRRGVRLFVRMFARPGRISSRTTSTRVGANSTQQLV